MSERERKSVVTILLILLPIIAFLAGYFTNDYVDTVRANGLNSPSDRPQFAIFWEAWNRIEQNYIGTVPDTQQMTYAAVRGAVSSLNDPYTVFLEPVVRQEEIISLSGNFGGIGVDIDQNAAGEFILYPLEGNPASAAGILTGDVLLAIDGEPLAAGLTTAEIAQRLRGEKGTKVTLTVRHPDTTSSVDITIERDDILVPSVIARLLPDAPVVGYIQLSRFSAESKGEMEKAVSELLAQGATGLILDLRGNGGGLLDAAVDIADLFVADGVLLYQESRSDGERVYKATAPEIAQGVPLVVLIDGGTASAAEILAGALQDRGRATLIGSISFGKGSVQLVYDLSDGSSIHVTSARWYTPNRNEIDQVGLMPNIVVEPAANGQDAPLAQAITFLSK